MSPKLISTLALAVAIIAGGISAIVVTNNRAATARALADKAEAEEAKAKFEARQAAAEQAAAEAKAAEEKAKQKTAEAQRDAAREERMKSDADARATAEEAKRAEAERETARLRTKTAQAQRDAAADERGRTNDILKAQIRAAELAAKQAEADAAKEAARLATTKTKNDAMIAEAKLLELRRIDFETLAQELAEIKRDLDEREAALKPEKTAADLQWVGERDFDYIGEDTNTVRRKVRVLPENDTALPVESRRLAKTERLQRERQAERELAVSNRVVSTLARHYAAALVRDRVVEANYYLKNIRLYYPNWKIDAQTLEDERAAFLKEKEEGRKQ